MTATLCARLDRAHADVITHDREEGIMGYSYGATESGRWALACDNCGNTGGVRKRTCPYKVLDDSSHSASGSRYAMSYCYPPALCSSCYRKLGGLRGVHGDSCRDGAARSQAEYDEKQRRLDAGEMMVVAAWGSWHEDVPDGWVAVVTSDGHGGEAWFEILDTEYGNGGFVTDYPSARARAPVGDGRTTKEVSVS